MESYRLYELGFHLQLSEQLPLGATVDMLSDPVADTDDDQAMSLPVKGYASNLVAAQLDELKVLYGDTYDDQSIENVNSSITRYKSYTIRDSHNRLTKFGSQQSEHANSVHESSYVHLRTRHASNTFGRIDFIFDHSFNNKNHTLACVHWYEDSLTDSTSGLFHVNRKTKNNSVPAIVYLTQLSKPLIHATDEINEDKLWILNHNIQN